MEQPKITPDPRDMVETIDQLRSREDMVGWSVRAMIDKIRGSVKRVGDSVDFNNENSREIVKLVKNKYRRIEIFDRNQVYPLPNALPERTAREGYPVRLTVAGKTEEEKIASLRTLLSDNKIPLERWTGKGVEGLLREIEEGDCLLTLRNGVLVRELRTVCVDLLHQLHGRDWIAIVEDNQSYWDKSPDRIVKTMKMRDKSSVSEKIHFAKPSPEKPLDALARGITEELPGLQVNGKIVGFTNQDRLSRVGMLLLPLSSPCNVPSAMPIALSGTVS